MKMITLVAAASAFIAINAWLTAQIGNRAVTLTLARAGDSAEPVLASLDGKLDRLASRIEQGNSALGRLVDAVLRNHATPGAPVALRSVPMTVVDATGTSQTPPGEQVERRPGVMFVNPTPEQNEDFEVLRAQLDDQVFLSGLNLQEFAGSVTLQSLPEPLQMLLIQKAIARYNSGKIAADVFLGPNSPVNR